MTLRWMKPAAHTIPLTQGMTAAGYEGPHCKASRRNELGYLVWKEELKIPIYEDGALDTDEDTIVRNMTVYCNICGTEFEYELDEDGRIYVFSNVKQRR